MDFSHLLAFGLLLNTDPMAQLQRKVMLQKEEGFRCASQIFILKSYLHEVCHELDTH